MIWREKFEIQIQYLGREEDARVKRPVRGWRASRHLCLQEEIGFVCAADRVGRPLLLPTLTAGGWKYEMKDIRNGKMEKMEKNGTRK